MSNWFGGLAVGFQVVLAVVVLVWALLWFCLPFLVYGMARRLKTLCELQQRSNDLLRSLQGPSRSSSDLGSKDNPFH